MYWDIAMLAVPQSPVAACLMLHVVFTDMRVVSIYSSNFQQENKKFLSPQNVKLLL